MKKAKIGAGALLTALTLLSNAAQAQAQAHEPQNVVSFSASASEEVTHDLLTITLSTTKEGNDAGQVQAALKQALDAALGEAKKAAQPGRMDLRTGDFSLHPRYSQQGRISGWQGSVELVLEGKDLARIAQTAAKLNTLSISNITQGLSREARERHEAVVTERAIAAYKAKAQDYAKQFGFAGYLLREVNIASNEQGGFPRPMMMARAKMAMAEDAQVPVEAGKGVVTVTVSGSVVLK
ncbi:SIMPL domain-containing protein [Aquabacterium sp. A7-Y]|uniref:SIMPL domain-containing protein n=1 Tax=Aquabacterium sp. A7-Y TaxID=1349605 RepID=UPI00223DF9D8|nr:SIMPL domain-containing protein [Aquabacterium sp. A7-Y]MCW7539655.1 SIMPL domain-containing protein [Aquabacterium sp. A7-Y]